jgi:hypothetical protein
LGSVEKARSGIAAGVLNSTRQTGSVLGVALFGSLAGQESDFMTGAHESLVISACLLLAAGAAIWRGASTRKEGIARPQRTRALRFSSPAQREMRAAERHHGAKAQRREAREHA